SGPSTTNTSTASTSGCRPAVPATPWRGYGRNTSAERDTTFPSDSPQSKGSQMARKATVTAQPKTLADGTVVWRPKYGRKIIGKYVADPEEAKANGYDFLRRSTDLDRDQLTVREWYLRWTDEETGAYTAAKGRSVGTV